MVVRCSQQETLDPGFVLLGTLQQGVPVVLRGLMLLEEFYPMSPSFTRSMSLKDYLQLNDETTLKTLSKSTRYPSNPDISHASDKDPEPLFYPLRQNSLILEYAIDSSHIYELQKIVRSKVAETPIRYLVMKKITDSHALIISCSTYFNDDDAVLKWQRDINNVSFK
ncbi:unnamed protein product [Schistosoma margrebowiei]|uniref:Uncharacterized protein n=1 Tax=Schistosoma margrebowiei TaxID=48269 RepID=A0A183M0V4_9TREM|nr:unnamed protein product [Schistosoma margrebowiei]